MNTGLVSIVVPIYKSEKYLDQCIGSIVNQTYRNLEVLLVDDGSPDNCPKMCDDWAARDPRIRVIHKQNAGSGMARNTGIEHATGEYICFFDSDDYLMPDAVEKACRKAREEQADIVVFGMQSIDPKGQIVKTNIPTSSAAEYTGNSVRKIFLPDLIDCEHSGAETTGLCLSLWVCLFSMELIRNSGWRMVSEREILSEDSYSLIGLYQNVNRVALLPEVLYCYRLTEGSLSNTYKQDRLEKIKGCYDACLDLANRCGYGEEVRRSISGLCISLTVGMMKQIVAGQKLSRECIRMLKTVENDETIRRCLEDISCRQYGWKRRVLFRAMRNRMTLAVFLVSYLQILKK